MSDAITPTPIGFAPNPFDASATMAAIYKSLADAQATIPDGHSHAILLDGTYTQKDGASGWISYVQKAPDGWNVVIDGSYDKPHGAGAGFMVGKSW